MWTVAHVAVYVVLPQIALGAAAYLAEARTRGRGAAVRIGAAAAVALFYTAALVASHGVVERLVR